MSMYRCIEHIRKNKIVYAVIFISVYAFYLRMLKLANHGLWVDELYQVSVAQVPFVNFIKNMPRIEYCSYLSGDYILIYPFVKLFSYNKWGLAIPHIISTILGFYLLYLICKLYFKSIWGYIITFTVICFNATLINHATEIRVYAVLPTLALAVFYFSQLLAKQTDIGLKRKFLIGVFMVLAIWFHPYGIVMVLSCFAYSLASKLFSSDFVHFFKRSAIFLFIVLCVASPLWLLSVFGPHVAYRQDCRVFEFIPDPAKDTIGFLKGIFGNLVGSQALYFLLVGAFFPLFLPFKDKKNQIALLFITVFLPIGLILFADVKTKYWFVQRQFIWVMPFFALFLGSTWESLFLYFAERKRIK